MLKVIDFWAPWCGPCKVLGPVIDRISEKYEGDETVTVEKVNVDDNMELAKQFEVRSIPTVVFLKDGEVVNKFVGTKTETEILKMINESLAN